MVGVIFNQHTEQELQTSDGTRYLHGNGYTGTFYGGDAQKNWEWYLKKLKEAKQEEEVTKMRHEKEQKILEIQKPLEGQVRQPDQNNGMVGPASKETAFSSEYDFTARRYYTSGTSTLSSKPAEESFLSYSYRMNRERLSLHESAPGSRWPQRLSAQRNCGFAGGVHRGLRRDAVNKEEERDLSRSPRRVRRRRMVAVPQGLQDAMRKGVMKHEDVDVLDDAEEDEEYYSAEEGDDWFHEEKTLVPAAIQHEDAFASGGIAIQPRTVEPPYDYWRQYSRQTMGGETTFTPERPDLPREN